MLSEFDKAGLSDVKKFGFSEARANLTSMVTEACNSGARAVITKFNKPVAALVPILDFYKLKEMDKAEFSKMKFDVSTNDELVDFVSPKPSDAAVEQLVLDISRVLQNPVIRKIVENSEIDPTCLESIEQLGARSSSNGESNDDYEEA